MSSLTANRPSRNAGGHVGRVSATRGDAGRAGRDSRIPGSALGIYAKYKFKAQKVDPETGEIIGLDPMETRVQRFILQAAARSLFPKSRLDKCLRLRTAHQDIQVWKSIEHKTTHYKGLQTCGSVWRCPVCSAKIAERRRVEILQAMEGHKAAGGCVNLLTLTCPHQVGDNLAELLAKQAKALNLFWSDRVVKGILAEMGTIGQIRALEVTHGRLSERNNGWHPHYHVLMFQGSGVDLMRFDAPQMGDWQVRLYLRWAARCKAAGLGEPSYAHGLKLDDGSKAAKYVSKWGLEDEMTKGHTKKASQGETPFDFLRAIVQDKEDKQAAALFVEFAKTFEGKRQLHWSKGLKKLYLVAEKTDDALAAETEDKARLLGMITLEQWRDVLAVEGRAVVLQVASSGGWDAVVLYLEQIRGSGKKETGGDPLAGRARSSGCR
jgi:hypothetical protein